MPPETPNLPKLPFQAPPVSEMDISVLTDYRDSDMNLLNQDPVSRVFDAHSFAIDPDDGTLTIYRFFPYNDYEDLSYAESLATVQPDPSDATLVIGPDGPDEVEPLDTTFYAFDTDILSSLLDNGTVRPVRVFRRGEWRSFAVNYTDDPAYTRPS